MKNVIIIEIVEKDGHENGLIDLKWYIFARVYYNY